MILLQGLLDFTFYHSAFYRLLKSQSYGKRCILIMSKRSKHVNSRNRCWFYFRPNFKCSPQCFFFRRLLIMELKRSGCYKSYLQYFRAICRLESCKEIWFALFWKLPPNWWNVKERGNLVTFNLLDYSLFSLSPIKFHF